VGGRKSTRDASVGRPEELAGWVGGEGGGEGDLEHGHPQPPFFSGSDWNQARSQ
jgi:hypothetical protein